MGYYARGDGEIVLKKVDEAKREDLLDSISSCYEIRETYDHDTGGTGISVYVYDKFYPEDIDELLEEIKPYTLCGDIEYCGEDDEFWKYHFNPERGKWEEHDGRVFYPTMMVDRSMCERYETLSDEGKTLIQDIFDKLRMQNPFVHI